MNASKLYRLRMLIRPREGPGPEQEYEMTASHRSRVLVRRLALDTVYQSGMIVSRFLSIQTRSKK